MAVAGCSFRVGSSPRMWGRLNPALNGLLGEHPDFGAVAGLNIAYGLVAERLCRDNPAMARLLWGVGTAMAIYWIAYDSAHGVNGPERTWRVSIPIARW